MRYAQARQRVSDSCVLSHRAARIWNRTGAWESFSPSKSRAKYIWVTSILLIISCDCRNGTLVETNFTKFVRDSFKKAAKAVTKAPKAKGSKQKSSWLGILYLTAQQRLRKDSLLYILCACILRQLCPSEKSHIAHVQLCQETSRCHTSSEMDPDSILIDKWS